MSWQPDADSSVCPYAQVEEHPVPKGLFKPIAAQMIVAAIRAELAVGSRK